MQCNGNIKMQFSSASFTLCIVCKYSRLEESQQNSNSQLLRTTFTWMCAVCTTKGTCCYKMALNQNNTVFQQVEMVSGRLVVMKWNETKRRKKISRLKMFCARQSKHLRVMFVFIVLFMANTSKFSRWRKKRTK